MSTRVFSEQHGGKGDGIPAKHEEDGLEEDVVVVVGGQAAGSAIITLAYAHFGRVRDAIT